MSQPHRKDSEGLLYQVRQIRRILNKGQSQSPMSKLPPNAGHTLKFLTHLTKNLSRQPTLSIFSKSSQGGLRKSTVNLYKMKGKGEMHEIQPIHSKTKSRNIISLTVRGKGKSKIWESMDKAKEWGFRKRVIPKHHKFGSEIPKKLERGGGVEYASTQTTHTHISTHNNTRSEVLTLGSIESVGGESSGMLIETISPRVNPGTHKKQSLNSLKSLKSLKTPSPCFPTFSSSQKFEPPRNSNPRINIEGENYQHYNNNEDSKPKPKCIHKRCGSALSLPFHSHRPLLHSITLTPKHPHPAALTPKPKPKTPLPLLGSGSGESGKGRGSLKQLQRVLEMDRVLNTSINSRGMKVDGGTKNAKKGLRSKYGSTTTFAQHVHNRESVKFGLRRSSSLKILQNVADLDNYLDGETTPDNRYFGCPSLPMKMTNKVATEGANMIKNVYGAGFGGGKSQGIKVEEMAGSKLNYLIGNRKKDIDDNLFKFSD